MSSGLELDVAAADLAKERSELIQGLWDAPSGGMWCSAHTDLVDRAIRLAFDSAAGFKVPSVAVLATGGYGRRELAPESDVDLCVVPLDDADPETDQFIRRLFRAIQTVVATGLKMEVGYAYRLVSDLPGLDAKSRTSLIDVRYVVGDLRPYRELTDAFWDSVPVGEFLVSKRDERLDAWAHHNDSPLAVEPNVKEGAGGLRSFQAANWIRMALGERPLRPSDAYETVLCHRNLLHAACGRRVDHLSRSRQAEIADRLGQEVQHWMGAHFQAAEALLRGYDEAVERIHEARFELSPNVVALRGELRVSNEADLSDAAQAVNLATKLCLRISSAQPVSNPNVRGPEMLRALAGGIETWRALDRCGLLSAILPELDRCRTLVPPDSLHTHTVFEHSLRVTEALRSREAPTFIEEMRGAVGDMPLLIFASLMHDVGRAVDEATHAEVGAAMVRHVGERWGLSEDTIELAAWLVEHHLVVSQMVRLRDVYNPQTALEFARIVGDSDRLRMLCLLTWADVNSVAPGVWTPSWESMLRDLYARTLAALESAEPETDPAPYRRLLSRRLQAELPTREEVDAFLDSLPAHYVVSTPIETVRTHLAYVRRALSEGPVVELHHVPELGGTEVTVCCQDKPGLLSEILGVIYALDLRVGGVRACTTESDPPVALDVFTINFSDRPVPDATCRRLSEALHRVLTGQTTADELLLASGRDPDREQSFLECRFVEGDPGVLEVKTPRGRGMAFRLSRTIRKQGWEILSARVGQWGSFATAAFYIVGKDHRPLGKDEVESALSARV